MKYGWVIGGLAVGGAALFLFSKKARARAEVGGSGSAVEGAADQTGVASWYGPGFAGKLTANQEIFDPENTDDLTAAHKTLPFNTVVEVTDTDTGRSVFVRINDRGPYVAGRIIDLSSASADALGIKQKGHANVELRVVA